MKYQSSGQDLQGQEAQGNMFLENKTYFCSQWQQHHTALTTSTERSYLQKGCDARGDPNLPRFTDDMPAHPSHFSVQTLPLKRVFRHLQGTDMGAQWPWTVRDKSPISSGRWLCSSKKKHTQAGCSMLHSPLGRRHGKCQHSQIWSPRRTISKTQSRAGGAAQHLPPTGQQLVALTLGLHPAGAHL